MEEKKKLDQLRKEKEEERQLQELQRLQEEQTGKKSKEKLEWMYATPATGSSQNANDLEDYLLGKKRVDKILIGTENEKVKLSFVLNRFYPSKHSPQIGASHKNFIAVQNANTARDIAAKIREDPLLAIKQQEAAAYEALMSNPLRLREMQERNGIKPSKKEKKDKRRDKKERKEQRRRERERHNSPMSYSDDERDDDRRRTSQPRRSPSPRDRYSRSPVDSRRYRDRDDRHHPSYSPPRRSDRRSHSPEPRHGRRQGNYGMDTSRSRASDERQPRWPRSDESDPDVRERRARSRSRSPDMRIRHDGGGGPRKRYRSPSPVHDHKRTRPSPPLKPPTATSASEDRAARLAAMSSNAAEMSTERKDRLNALLEKEKVELEVEERARAKSKGMGGFLSNEQKKVFGGHGGLEERLRRGRAGLVAQVD